MSAELFGAIQGGGHALKSVETNDKSDPVLETDAAMAAEVRDRMHEVDIEVMIDQIPEFTMRTVVLPFEEDVARAFLREHDSRADGAVSTVTDTDAALLEKLGRDIQSEIDGFGGAVFLKLSSRSPKDASLSHQRTADIAKALVGDPEWLANMGYDTVDANAKLAAILQAIAQSLKTTNGPEGIDLLLSSERVYEDINLELTGNPSGGFEMNVIVREWIDLPVHLEFRGFVHAGKLKAMGQYNYPVYYPTIPANADLIASRCQDLFNNDLSARLDMVDNYVIDFAFCGYDIATARIVVIEINPYGGYAGNGTAAGLFSWDDPEPLESDDFVFRFNDNPETDVPSITHLRIAKNIKDFMAAVE